MNNRHSLIQRMAIMLLCMVSVNAFAQQRASGVAFTIPFSTMTSDDKEQCKSDFGQFTIIDNNGDGKMWTYMSYAKAMSSPTKTTNDDYAILPGAVFTDTSCNYELSFDMSSNMRNMTSDIEVWIASAPTVEGMKQKIGEFKNFSVTQAQSWVNQTCQFAVPDGVAGTYYIAFREVTVDDGTQDRFPCIIRNIAVKAIESSASAPSQVSDAVVTAGEKGALTATVSFTMPRTMMNGKEFAEGTMLKATVASSVDTASVTAAIGTQQALTVNTVQGDNTLTIKVDGDAEGEALPLSVYTGVYRPMRVQGLTAVVSEDNMSMTLTWQKPVASEKEGGYCDYDDLTYEIYLGDTEASNLVATVEKGIYSYTYSLPAGAEQRSTCLYVLGHNAAGTSKDYFNYTYDDNDTHLTQVIGSPYTMPATETFPSAGKTSYYPLSTPGGSYYGKWLIQDPTSWIEDDNQVALVGYSPFDGDEEPIETAGRIQTPKFSTEGITNAAIKVKAMNSSTYSNKLSVYARTYGTDYVKVGDIDCSKAESPVWEEYSFPLPEQFQNKKWINIAIDADYTDASKIYIIDSYSLYYASDADLTVNSMAGPSELSVGEEGTFSAIVSNQGMSASDATGHFEVACDGKLIAKSDDMTAQQIAVTASNTFTWTYVPQITAKDKSIEVSFVITTADDVAANNTKTVTVSVLAPEQPVVIDLTANEVGNGEGVQLTWTQPDAVKPITESFEQLTPFYYGTEYMDFKGIDDDGKDVFTFSSNSMTNEGVAKSWLVVDYTQLSSKEGLEAHTGSKYLMAICPYTDQNVAAVAADDWLVSPEVKAGSRMSLYLNIINEQYPETFRVLSSSTTADVSAFRQIETFTVEKRQWKQYSFVLPEDARYFAVNYVSKDKFGILLDDIKYSPLSSLFSISGYNVYRNGIKIGTSETTSFADSEGRVGDEYTVRVIADGSEMIDSNVAKAEASVISTISEDGENRIVYYNLQGVKMHGNLPAGVYIRTVNGKSSKVVVK